MTKHIKFIILFLLTACLSMTFLPGTAAATENTVTELPSASAEALGDQAALTAIEPDSNSINVVEGGTYTLSASGISGTITWASGNTAVATVSSSGVVTGVKAGTTTVTASVGGTVQQTFYVYVRIADGIYYISRNGFRLGTGGLVDNGTRVYLYSPSSAGFTQLTQAWKITYLAGGYYSIRPMYKLDMGLHATTHLVDITSVSTTDTLSSVALAHRWGIEYKNGSYTFKYTNSSSMALYNVSPYSGGAITVANCSTNAAGFFWTLQKVTSISNQTVLINTETGAYAVNSTHYIDPGETATLAQLGITATFVSASSNDQSFTWTSSSSSNVTVNSAGAVTGMTPGGTATITATHYLNGSGYQAQYTVKVKPIPDGTYFVRNPASERYLQIDNDTSSNNYSTSGATMEQWYYTGGNYQKWTFTFRGNGYYSITSVQSGLALSVPSGQTGSTNVNLVQETYYGYDRQKWSITQTGSGYYKIKPKSASSDLVMAVGSSDVSVVDGVKIQQRTYTNDTTYIDEWVICVFDLSILLAIDDADGASRHDYFSSTQSNLQTEKNAVVSVVSTLRYSACTDAQMINYLKSNDIFIIHTHGQKTGFKIGDGSYLTLSDIANEDLSNVDFALLMTCNTGVDFDPSNITNRTPVNIIEQMVICGAETVIGFNDTTRVYDCNKFAPDLTQQLIIEGLSVEDAIDSISYTSYVNNMADLAEIAGNADKKLR